MIKAKYTIKLTQEFNIQEDEENLETAITRAKEKIAWYQFSDPRAYNCVGYTEGWEDEEYGEFNP